MLFRSASVVGLALASPAHVFGQAAPKESGFKIGVVDWELTRPGDPEALALAARLGFDGVQVDLGDLQTIKKADAQDRYEQLTRKYRIQIASLALGKLSDYVYGSDTKAQELVDSAIDITVALSQKVLLLAFFGKNGLSEEGNKLDRLVARLKENAVKAEKKGVILGIEGEASAKQYQQIVDRVGSSSVKVYFDCVHAHEEGKDIYEEITSLGDRICEFHAKDYGNILFGNGKIDFKAVRRAMDAIKYRGWIQVEQWGEIAGEKPLGPIETHRRNLQFLRELFPPRVD